jgi:hypothetical protein
MSLTNDKIPNDDIEECLRTLIRFHLDNSRIQLLINAFNKYGANVSYNTIEELTQLDQTSSIEMRDTLASLVHFHIDHKKLFEDTLSISTVDKQIVKDVRLWIKKLTKKGLKGLNILYFALNSEGSPTLESIDYNLMLGEILDENGKPVGHLPLLRLELELLNGNGPESNQSIFLSLENFNGLIKKVKGFSSEGSSIGKKLSESAWRFRNTC